MSVPGMGDVYCGILAALMAQKMDASEAILFASYSHGAGCDQLVNQRKGMIGITASDSIDATNKFIQSFLNS